jgi:hypothetical protein
VALLVGCGTNAEADPAASKQEFLAEGDSICADGQFEAADLARRAQEIQAQSGTLSESELLDRASEVWGNQIALIETYRDRFDELDPPEGDEARIEELIASFDDGIAIARDIKAALDDDEEPSPELVQTYAGIVARGNTLARAYGFLVCGAS